MKMKNKKWEKKLKRNEKLELKSFLFDKKLIVTNFLIALLPRLAQIFWLEMSKLMLRKLSTWLTRWILLQWVHLIALLLLSLALVMATLLHLVSLFWFQASITIQTRVFSLCMANSTTTLYRKNLTLEQGIYQTCSPTVEVMSNTAGMWWTMLCLIFVFVNHPHQFPDSILITGHLRLQQLNQVQARR